ncbi:MAG: glycosyltransferase [Acidobacteriota bacterium]
MSPPAMAELGFKDRWRARLEGRFWGHSLLWRRPMRHVLSRLAALRHRWRARHGQAPVRVLHTVRRGQETARSLFIPGHPVDAPHKAGVRVEDTVLAEGLRMAAAAEDLDVVAAGALRGFAAPRPGDAPAACGRILEVVGDDSPEIDIWPLRRSGAYLLSPGSAESGDPVVRRPLGDVDRALDHLPADAGPPATLFLLPYLAVGGAERLLFDLLEDLVRDTDRRHLVVTLDPHRGHLGNTVDRCRRLTPYVFTLGDWLPRHAAFSALRHLIRRFRVEQVFSWNGTVDFFDRAHELRRDFPRLRLFSQLYHHEGGWTARTSPRVIQAVDRHIAVNRTIAEALRHRGVPEARIELVHHGVAVPAETPSDEDRAERRRQLGLPEEAVVLGTFIRLHRQKRPLDILRLARRFTGEDVYFLLVGGGPLDDEVDAALAEEPIPNLIRHGLTREPLPLYDALDLCLMTSSYEGLPVFLLDGLARGIPGVAPAVGDIPLLFGDGGGLLVDRAGDIDGLVAAVRRLLDPEERARRGAAARRTVRDRFDLTTYRRAYRRLLTGPDAGGGAA